MSASLFGISAPLSKILLEDSSPVVLAGLLYLGAFVGLTVFSVTRRKKSVKEIESLGKRDLP